MVRKIFFIGFGIFTLVCCALIVIYGGYSSMIFIPLGFSLLITGIKLKTNHHMHERKLLVKKITLLMKGKSDFFVETHCCRQKQTV